MWKCVWKSIIASLSQMQLQGATSPHHTWVKFKPNKQLLHEHELDCLCHFGSKHDDDAQDAQVDRPKGRRRHAKRYHQHREDDFGIGLFHLRNVQRHHDHDGRRGLEKTGGEGLGAVHGLRVPCISTPPYLEHLNKAH